MIQVGYIARVGMKLSFKIKIRLGRRTTWGASSSRSTASQEVIGILGYNTACTILKSMSIFSKLFKQCYNYIKHLNHNYTDETSPWIEFKFNINVLVSKIFSTVLQWNLFHFQTIINSIFLSIVNETLIYQKRTHILLIMFYIDENY